MTLGKKKIRKTPKKFVPRLIIPTEKGLKYIPTGRLFEYPIFIGDVVVHTIGVQPLLVEFKSEGKNYVFVFYDKKLGMVAKARIPRRHSYYIIQELISRKGKVPLDGLINRKKIEEILETSNMTRYTG